MKAPRLMVRAPDRWLANQLHAVAESRRWLLDEGTRPHVEADLHLLRASVLFLQTDARDGGDNALSLVAHLARAAPELPIVLVSDTKLPDAERILWSATAFDLGARCVLFPPLTAEDIVDLAESLMAIQFPELETSAGTRNSLYGREKSLLLEKSSDEEEVIDLAEGVYEDS